jgi:hypothetical protein
LERQRSKGTTLQTITGAAGADGTGAGQATGEPLHESERTVVARGRTEDGRPVVVKRPVGPGAAERLRHEVAILQRLVGIDGIVQLAAAPAADAVVLEETGPGTLRDLLAGGPLRGTALVELAAGLARAVAGMHRAGVVHKDVNPANVVVSSGGPVLIDFELATTNALEQPDFTHHDEIVGTLAYLAPEQTGRTGRSVDHRADLYALGATLYEAATGAPPFGDTGPLQLVHAHLAATPTPPAELDPSIPAAFSDIVVRLLEKEPDRRYQSADGVVHDLAVLEDRLTTGTDPTFALGTRDYPLRLSPPARLVGRDDELAVLQRALDAAVGGHARGVFVAGAPGVGKTALVDELRPMVTAAGGWFVSGKFDQHRQDLEASAVRQALRALGRLLLAEPDDELVPLRSRLLDALGSNAGGAAALLPEFGVLLDIEPGLVSTDAAESTRRISRAGVDLLSAVVSPARPLVVVIDDLQWATPQALGLIDAVLTEARVPGLVLVGAYRDTEVDAAHPLTTLLDRWERLGVAPVALRLANLGAADLGALLGELLALEPGAAARLADAVGARTAGNPYDTLELLNALRRDGTLARSEDGWTWDDAAVRRYVGSGDVVDLLHARLAALPARTRALLDAMACLGGQVPVRTLAIATGVDDGGVRDGLLPALEDGLLVPALGAEPAVRFRHDRVQEAAGGLAPATRTALRLGLARRLAADPLTSAAAAEQYLAGIDGLDDPAERAAVAVRFRDAAAAAAMTNSVVAERYAAAAIALLDGRDDGAAVELLVVLEIERHGALYNPGASTRPTPSTPRWRPGAATGSRWRPPPGCRRAASPTEAATPTPSPSASTPSPASACPRPRTSWAPSSAASTTSPPGSPLPTSTPTSAARRSPTPGCSPPPGSSRRSWRPPCSPTGSPTRGSCSRAGGCGRTTARARPCSRRSATPRC